MKKYIKRLLREGLTSKINTDEIFSVYQFNFTPEEKEEILKSVDKTYVWQLESIKKQMEESKRNIVSNTKIIERVKTAKEFEDDRDVYIEMFEEKLKEAKRKYDDMTKWYENYMNDKDKVVVELVRQEMHVGVGYRIIREKIKAENMNKKLSREDLIDLFITALEGGSNYWYYIKHIPRDVLYAINHMGSSGSDAIANYLMDGGKIYFYDIEEVDVHDDSDALSVEDDDKGYLGYVDLDTILEGITLLKRDYDDIYERIIDEQYDANDADVFLQLCVMGEVVYG